MSFDQRPNNHAPEELGQREGIVTIDTIPNGCIQLFCRDVAPMGVREFVRCNDPTHVPGRLTRHKVTAIAKRRDDIAFNEVLDFGV